MSKITKISALLIATVLFTLPAFAAPEVQLRNLPAENNSSGLYLPYNPANLMVKFRPETDGMIIDNVIESIEGTIAHHYHQIGWHLIRYDLEINPDELRGAMAANDTPAIQRLLDIAVRTAETKAEMLRNLPQVETVEYDYFFQLFETDYTPDDPFFIDMDPVAGITDHQQWTSFDVQLPEAWDLTQGSEDVILAIIDTGVDTDHPDLADNIARWPNGDVRGYDYVGGKNGTILEIILPVQEDDNPDIHHNDGVDDGWGLPDPSAGDGADILGLASDECDLGVFHGTHCASCASAVTDNAEGVAGAGFSVKIMPVRCANPEGGLSEYIFGTVSVLTMGINWAVDNGADIISMSLGLPLEVQGLHDACIYAYNEGVAVFAASGNSGANEIYYPAAYDETFAVGSFSQAHNRAEFSTYGYFLDALAGGGHLEGSNLATAEWIWGCHVASVCDANTTPGITAGDHGYAAAMGTSMACPQAAGIAGLVLSAAPGMSPDALFNILRQSALDIGPPGWDEETGAGILQAYNAVQMASATYDLTVAFTPYGIPIQIPANGGSFEFNISITNNDPAAAICDIWTDITLPSGTLYGPILGPFNLSIPGGGFIERDRNQFIPAAAPAGDYSYNGYAGVYPDDIWTEDSFTFEKVEAEDGGREYFGWNCEGESFSEHNISSVIITDSPELHPAFPNPFNPETQISFTLPSAGKVSLLIYDVQGREIARLLDGYANAGIHEVTFSGGDLPSGIYFVRMTAGNYSQTQKVLLMK